MPRKLNLKKVRVGEMSEDTRIHPEVIRNLLSQKPAVCRARNAEDAEYEFSRASSGSEQELATLLKWAKLARSKDALIGVLVEWERIDGSNQLRPDEKRTLLRKLARFYH